RRGYHASGTPTVRPSLSSTQKLSSLKVTSLGEVVIPSLLELVAVVGIHRGDFAECLCVETIVTRQLGACRKPELRFSTSLENVDMGRLQRAAFVGIKEELEPIQAQDDRHSGYYGQTWSYRSARTAHMQLQYFIRMLSAY